MTHPDTSQDRDYHQWSELVPWRLVAALAVLAAFVVGYRLGLHVQHAADSQVTR